jgi:septal ring-binding cell division protein DamX
MSWPRAPLFLATAIVSAALLGVFVWILAAPEKVLPVLVPVTETAAKTTAATTIAANFGRLDELVPFAGGVTPVAAEVQSAPPAHAPEFRDAAWLKAQSPDSFTIQVMAAHDEEAVKHFLAGREDRPQYFYFLSSVDGSDWYVVTTGSFTSREIAIGAAESKDFGLPSKPFPKRFGIYQQAVNAGAAATTLPASPVSAPTSP